MKRGLMALAASAACLLVLLGATAGTNVVRVTRQDTWDGIFNKINRNFASVETLATNTVLGGQLIKQGDFWIGLDPISGTTYTVWGIADAGSDRLIVEASGSDPGPWRFGDRSITVSNDHSVALAGTLTVASDTYLPIGGNVWFGTNRIVDTLGTLRIQDSRGYKKIALEEPGAKTTNVTISGVTLTISNGVIVGVSGP